MADPFIAEIRIFPFNVTPTGWARCDGQLMPIMQNTALFSLLGTTYGGDGMSTFALPDLMGRAPMHPGQGPGLSLHDLGESGGSETVTLTAAQMPMHAHQVIAQGAPGDTGIPTGFSPARTIGAMPYVPPAGAPRVAMAPDSVVPAGAGLPHNNMQPYLTCYFCIALQGIFPSRP
jgi:microcystin-dependent protein